MKNLSAAEIMQSPVICIRDTASVAEAWEILSANNISGAPVCDAKGSAIGVVSQSDLLRSLVEQDIGHYPKDSFYLGGPMWRNTELKGVFEQLSAISIRDIMSDALIAVSSETLLPELAETMCTKHIHRILVLEDEVPAGIVTAFDVLSLVAKVASE